MSDAPHLYGVPGAERLYDDASTVYEGISDKWPEGHVQDVLIEEWSSTPLRSFVRADDVIEHIIEYDLEEHHDEDGQSIDALERAAKDPAVIAAFDHTLDLLLASVGTWRWADQLLVTHVVTHDAEGRPMLDGEPLYRKVDAS